MSEPAYQYYSGEIHERACRAIYATGRTHREIAILMGIDISIPLHKRPLLEPTEHNITKAAKILGVSKKWLITGIPQTEMDFAISRPHVALYGHNIIAGNGSSTIKINGGEGHECPMNTKNPRCAYMA